MRVRNLAQTSAAQSDTSFSVLGMLQTSRYLGPPVTVVSETGFNLVGLVGNLCKLTSDCSVCLSLR